MKLENGDSIDIKSHYTYAEDYRAGTYCYLLLSSKEGGSLKSEEIHCRRGEQDSAYLVFRFIIALGLSKQTKYLHSSKEEEELLGRAIFRMCTYPVEVKCIDETLKLEFDAPNYDPIIQKLPNAHIDKLCYGDVRVTLEGEDCVDDLLNELIQLEKEEADEADQ